MELNLNQPRLFGMLTPSSNTILEPLTSAMLAKLLEVSTQFGRFPVTAISLSDRAPGQFDSGTDKHACLLACPGARRDFKGTGVTRVGLVTPYLDKI